ncbi:uncharacterized protein LOC130635629 [Hydractinia symbiolongicarpus]|uniref:uncharacterized protein LOC130635629 n=1 Tax=Hydractinia symbiolongicarpus TaxID=13093 RepID=UPI00254D0081|nr:uncharacterized protein LOC130635629 [Hydractinia symbiolongicarpus]
MKVNRRVFAIPALLTFTCVVTMGKILRLPCLFFSDLSLTHKNSRPLVGTLATMNVTDDLECMKNCILHDLCQSINYNDKTKTCDMLNSTMGDGGNTTTKDNDWMHYESDPDNKEIGDVCSSLSPCKDHYCEDSCESPGFRCTCRTGFYGERCNQAPSVEPAMVA